jgi:Rrf2 family protein
MKLSRASSYALHAMEYLATHEQQKSVASHDIADAKQIPEGFLLKVLRPLVSAQVLRSVKGPNGGYRLARPANKITMLEVIEAVDGTIRGNAPLSQDSSRDDGDLDPRLAEVCEQIAEMIRKRLAKVKVSDLVSKA